MKRRSLIGLNAKARSPESKRHANLAVAAIVDCACPWSGAFLRALGERQITSFDESLEPLDSVRWFDRLVAGSPTQVLGFTRYRTLVAVQAMANYRDYVLVFKGLHQSKPNGMIEHSVSGSSRRCGLLADAIEQYPAEWSYVLGKTLSAFDAQQGETLSRSVETASGDAFVLNQIRYSWVLVPIR